MVTSLPSPSKPSVQVVGGLGPNTAYYWIVANFPNGTKSTPSPYGKAVGVPNTLSSTNYVSVSWTPTNGAVSYDVLKTTSPTLTSGNIALVLASTNTNVQDTGQPLQPYTLTTSANPQSCTLTYDGLNYSPPALVIPCLLTSNTSTVVNALTFPGSDIGQKVNNAIASLGASCGTIFIPAGTYNFTTPINADQTNSCTISGPGGLTAGATATVSLQYSGTATPISARSTYGFRLTGIQLVVTNSSFNGIGVDLGHTGTGCGGNGCDSALWEVDHDSFYATNGAQYSAVLNVRDAIEGTIKNNAFNGYVYGVSGALSASDYSNAITVKNNQFSNSTITQASIYGPTQGWNITGNTFEILSGTGTTVSFASNVACSGCTFSANWIGDIITTSAFNAVNVTGVGWNIAGNYVGLNPSNSQTAFNVANNAAGISFIGNTVANGSCAINFGTNIGDTMMLGNSFSSLIGHCGSNPSRGASSMHGYLQSYNALQVAGNSFLPSSTGSSLYLASGFGSPILGRIYVGDGTGWTLNFAKRSGSTDTDLFKFGDNGNLTLTTGSVSATGFVSPNISINPATGHLALTGPASSINSCTPDTSTCTLNGNDVEGFFGLLGGSSTQTTLDIKFARAYTTGPTCLVFADTVSTSGTLNNFNVTSTDLTIYATGTYYGWYLCFGQ
jgi:hypothetical protein